MLTAIRKEEIPDGGQQMATGIPMME